MNQKKRGNKKYETKKEINMFSVLLFFPCSLIVFFVVAIGKFGVLCALRDVIKENYLFGCVAAGIGDWCIGDN